MRRPFVISTGALALALLPAALYAQTPRRAAAARSARPAAAPRPPARARASRRSSDSRTTPGMLLVQVKPDQTAAFEEMVGEAQGGAWRRRRTPRSRPQGAGIKVYKATEAMGGNALYVVVVDPADAGHGVRPDPAPPDMMTDDAEARAGDAGDVQALRRRVRRGQQAEPDAGRRRECRQTARKGRRVAVPSPFLLPYLRTSDSAPHRTAAASRAAAIPCSVNTR